MSDGTPTTTAPRSVTATRYVDAAARGRLAARAGRGRRRRPVRPEVPRRRPGTAGARGRGRRSASSARALGLPVPELVLVELDPALGRAEPDPEIQELIAASGGREPRRRLPARGAAVRARRPGEPRPGAGRRRRVARRADDERRPHAAQPEPAVLARAAVAHRPRRGAVPPARGPTTWPRTPAAPFPPIAQHVLLPYAGSILDADARLAPRLDPRAASSAVVGAVPGRVARARPTRGAPTSSTSRARLAGAARLRGGGGGCPRALRPFAYAILRVVPRVERGEQLNAGVVLFCRRRRFLAARVELDERAAGRARPGPRPRRGRAPPRRARRDRRRRAGGRGGRRARAVRALRLARRAVEHDHPALARAHRALRGPAGDARPPVRRARRAGRVSARGRMIFVGECLTRTRAGAKVCAFPDAAGGPPRCPHAVRSAATVSRRRARARVAVVACPDRRSSWDSCSPCCSGRSSPHRPSRTRRR